MPSHFDRFTLVSDFELKGDQARAIPELVEGLQRGDTIRAVTGQSLQNLRDLAAAVAAPQRAWQVTIMRDGREVTATFRG